MLSNRSIALLLFLFLQSHYLMAQTWSGIENWKYIPSDDAYWNQFETIFNKNITAATLDFTYEKAKNKNIGHLDDAEYYIALADSLVASGFRQAGFNIYLDILKRHPGSFVSQKSLVSINSLLSSDNTGVNLVEMSPVSATGNKVAEKFDDKTNDKTNDKDLNEYDEDELSRIINQAAFKEVPESALDIVNYYSTSDDFKRKLKKWAQLGVKQLKKESYWRDRIRYYYAIQLYAENKVELAEQELRELAEKPGLLTKLKWRVQLQRARILFEQKKFAQADAIYKNTVFPSRVFGKVLLERAWSRFYLKDYSGALGLLETLKAPAFNYASNPEQYILSMVIYRELCHYPKVTILAEEFQKKFKNTYATLVANKPLKENTVLVWQTIQKPGYRESSSVVDAIIKERDRLTKVISLSDKSAAAQWLYSQYQARQIDLEKRLDRFMKNDLRDQANQFLTSWDQIKLADYISKLDEFRVKPIYENRRYMANTEELKSFNVLYWPVSGEYWKEEFEHYQVLLSDRCDTGAGVRDGKRE